jgi:hypothetical protein
MKWDGGQTHNHHFICGPQLLVVINILLSIYLSVFKHGVQRMLLKGMLLDIRVEN